MPSFSPKNATFSSFGFEVLVLRMGHHKIKDGDAPFDEFNFMDAAIAKVFFLDLTIKRWREQRW